MLSVDAAGMAQEEAGVAVFRQPLASAVGEEGAFLQAHPSRVQCLDNYIEVIIEEEHVIDRSWTETARGSSADLSQTA